MRLTLIPAGILVLLSSLGNAAVAADPAMMNLVMPDAQVLTGVNVTTASATPLGQYLMNELLANHLAAINGLIGEIGFDPRTDISEILAASSLSKSSGILIVRGRFQVDKIVTAITKSGPVKIQNYGGATLVIDGGEAKDAFAFLNGTMVLAGPVDEVKAAIDRSTHANSISPALAARVNTISNTKDAWAVSTSALAGLIPATPGEQSAATAILQMLKGVDSSTASVKFGDHIDIAIDLVATDAKNAQSLADVVKMLGALASMGAGSDPQFKAFADLLKNLQVKADGTAVNIALSIPEAQAEMLLEGLRPTTKKIAGLSVK